MGMNLSVWTVYGVAWDDAPAKCFPETVDGYELVEDGEPVYHGRLTWGGHGHTLGSNPGRHLAVCEAPSGGSQGEFAVRVPGQAAFDRIDIDNMIIWDAWVIDYLRSLGLAPGQIPAPGWLALGSFG